VYGLFCGIVNLMIVEFTIAPPRVFLLFLGAVLLISVFSLFLKKSNSIRKITALVIVVVLLGVVDFFFYRPAIVSVDDRGISVKRFRGYNLSWSDVQNGKTNCGSLSVPKPAQGAACWSQPGTYKVGEFRIENGSSARVVMEQDVEAMLITTAEEQHLLTSTGCRSTFAG
jgi:hypothetical protein